MVSVTIKGQDWDRLIKRYVNAKDRVGLVAAGVVQFAQDSMVAETRHQLDNLVYGAPITDSGYQRTGRTRRAVKKGPLVRVGKTASGEVLVDPSVANRDGFFYPAILNRGMRRYPKYYPRPFWTAALALIRVRFERKGRAAIKEIGQSLRVG